MTPEEFLVRLATRSEDEFEDVFTGARHTGGATPLSKLLAEFPVALLLRR